MKIYLDDLRPSPDRWIDAYWPNEVIEYLKTGSVEIISLDHDLGDDGRDTVYDVVLWNEEAVATKGLKAPQIRVHSAAIIEMRVCPYPKKWLDFREAAGHSNRLAFFHRSKKGLARALVRN